MLLPLLGSNGKTGSSSLDEEETSASKNPLCMELNKPRGGTQKHNIFGILRERKELEIPFHLYSGAHHRKKKVTGKNPP